MIKINKGIINKINKSTFLRKKTLMLEGIGACTFAYGLNNPEYLVLSFVAFAGAIYSVKKIYDDELDRYRKLKYLKLNEENYDSLLELCEEYINHIYEIIKKYEFNNKLDLCYALNYLLKDSMFSLNEFNYSKPKNTFGEIPDIGKSYVIEGSSCCRHNVDFMSSLFTKLEIPNFQIRVSTKFFRPNYTNHVLNAIVDKDRIIAFDFTGGMPLNIDLKKYTLMAEAPFENEFYPVYFKIGEFIRFYKIDDIYKLDTTEITDEEMISSRYVGKDLARIIKKDMLSDPFIEDMEELKKKISEKSLALAPRR